MNTTKTSIIIGFLAIAALFVLYIYLVNTEALARYSVETYQQEIEKISKENQNLVIGSLGKNSLTELAGLLTERNFEKTAKINYIKVLSGQIVSKQ